MRGLSLGLALLALAATGGWSSAAEPLYQPSAPDPGKTYLFVVYQPDSSLHLLEAYGPLVDYLNRNMAEARFQLEASPDCATFDVKAAGREFDFALANPRQTLDALHRGYHVIAKMAEDPHHSGIILVRRDSGIRQVADLKGHKVAFPSRTCLRGTIMPQYYLQTHGLDVQRDIENLYVGSHLSAIMNVYLGYAAAAGVKRYAWERFQQVHPEQAGELVAQWKTEPLINSAVLARDDVPPRITARTAQLLETLHTVEEGRSILARVPLSRFESADDARYQRVDGFLQQVDKVLRSRTRQP